MIGQLPAPIPSGAVATPAGCPPGTGADRRSRTHPQLELHRLRIRALTPRNADAQSSSVVSIDAPDTTISESSYGSAID